MKQCFKPGGPYKTADGLEYDVKLIESTERAPKNWSTDFEKVLVACAAKQKLESNPQQATEGA